MTSRWFLVEKFDCVDGEGEKITKRNRDKEMKTARNMWKSFRNMWKSFRALDDTTQIRLSQAMISSIALGVGILEFKRQGETAKKSAEALALQAKSLEVQSKALEKFEVVFEAYQRQMSAAPCFEIDITKTSKSWVTLSNEGQGVLRIKDLQVCEKGNSKKCFPDLLAWMKEADQELSKYFHGRRKLGPLKTHGSCVLLWPSETQSLTDDQRKKLAKKLASMKMVLKYESPLADGETKMCEDEFPDDLAELVGRRDERTQEL